MDTECGACSVVLYTGYRVCSAAHMIRAGKVLAGCWQGNGRVLAMCWQSACKVLVMCWQGAGRVLAKCSLTL